MDEGERIGEASPSEGGIMPMRSKSYNFLLGLSKKLGNVATKSFVEVRDFLNQELPLPSGERLFQTMPLILKRKLEEKEIDKSDKKNSAENLKKIVKQSQEILASANTVFPMTLFHDTVFLDRTKVTIIRRNFFWSADVMSIQVRDILNVTVSVGPLFASLTIVSRVMSTVDHFQISHLWRNDAVNLKHIIQGYVIAQHSKLDTGRLNKRELIRMLEELGHDQNTSY